MRFTKTLGVTAAAAALALAPAAAFAAGPYDISVGSTTSGPVPYTATTTGAIQFSTPLVNMSCSSAGASGDINTGTNVSGVNAASVLTTWSGCLGPLNLPMTVTPSGTWQLDATGDASGNQVPGEITNITAVVSQTSAPGNCTFTVTGSASGYFDKTTQQIVVNETGFTGDLTISNRIGGCYGGLVANGQPANFSGTYNVDTDGAGNVNIVNS